MTKLPDDDKVIMTSIKITKKTHRHAKLIANYQERTMSEVIEDATRIYTDREILAIENNTD